MISRTAALLILTASLAPAQTLENFSNVARPGAAYFAGGWASANEQPAATFAQSDGAYEIKGVTNSSAHYVDLHGPEGAMRSIGTQRALELSARLLAGNQAESFRVFLIDAAGNSAAATFFAADFSATEYKYVSAQLTPSAGFNPAAIERIRISGDVIDGVAPLAFAFNELLAVPRAGGDGAIRNFSALGRAGVGAEAMIAGFVLSGPSKQVLVRAVGPTLGSFGVTGALADPQLTLYRGSAPIAGNDDWSNDPALTAAAQRAGAFALPAGSRDAALLTTASPAAYTAVATGSPSGTALLEVYDAEAPTEYPAQQFTNLAMRATLGEAAAPLTTGFVITGRTAKKVLLRASGPALASLGIPTGFAADPELHLYRLEAGAYRPVASNDNWETGNSSAAIHSANRRAGAFPLPAGSRDAALLLTLPPGTYTLQATNKAGPAGTGLVELYAVP